MEIIRWSALWHSKNRLNGLREHLCFENGLPALFVTRKQCREWIAEKYGYIKTRRDLREEPHGWRIPRPVRVTITVNKTSYLVNLLTCRENLNAKAEEIEKGEN
jgi:hypothetical protein